MHRRGYYCRRPFHGRRHFHGRPFYGGYYPAFPYWGGWGISSLGSISLLQPCSLEINNFFNCYKQYKYVTIDYLY